MIIQIISLTIYKLTSLVTGVLLSYMGYKLFMAGIWGNAGDIEGKFNDNKFVLKKAAPGTFFILAGAIIIGFTIYKGLDYETTTSRSQVDDKPIITD